MISEIKQPIIQLNNGEVPNGYKKTEFGVFPCDWVTDKRLKEIGTFGKGKGLPGDKMTLEGVPCVGYGDIYMKYNNFHFEKAKSFVDKETASKSQPIRKGTLLFTGTGETAEEIGKCVCYNGDETIYAGGDIITFISNEVNPLFLAYQQYQDFSLRNKASFGQGHSVVHIRQNNLEKLHVAYPKSADEQSKIAEILMKWDEAIELYNQYIEKLKQLKSIWLKKMFPQKGERVPEWRFKGFTDAWEQRKLGDVLQTLPFKAYLKSPEQDGEFEIIQQGNDPIIGYANGEPCKDYEDTVIFGDHTLSLYKPKSPFFVATDGVRIIKGFDNMDGNYLLPLLERNKPQSEGYKRYYSILADIGVFFTENHEEQSKIGEYFSDIDNLITLHQCKVETIKAQQKVLKKYLLNGIVRV